MNKTDMNNKPIQNLDEDIASTLSKLHILLQYSSNPASDTVFSLIERAKRTWDGEDNEDEDSWGQE
jgi:hypothetical protein